MSNRGFSYNTNPKIVEITPIRADILTSRKHGGPKTI